MTKLAFVRLNEGWNAEPNDPAVEIRASGAEVKLRFALNPWAYKKAPEELGLLTFTKCSMWRLGGTNDEGWYRGQCRYSSIAPAWGEFYEITGCDPLAHGPTDWKANEPSGEATRHFLFYLRDETFECFAGDWSFSRLF